MGNGEKEERKKVSYFIVDALPLQRLLFNNEEQSGQQHDHSVTAVAEHDGEQEWKRNDRIRR